MDNKHSLDFVTFDKQEDMTVADFITRHLDDIVIGSFAATGANMAILAEGHPLLFAISLSVGSFLTWLLYTAGSAFVGVMMKKLAEVIIDYSIRMIGTLQLYWRMRNRKKK